MLTVSQFVSPFLSTGNLERSQRPAPSPLIHLLSLKTPSTIDMLAEGATPMAALAAIPASCSVMHPTRQPLHVALPWCTCHCKACGGEETDRPRACACIQPTCVQTERSHVRRKRRLSIAHAPSFALCNSPCPQPRHPRASRRGPGVRPCAPATHAIHSEPNRLQKGRVRGRHAKHARLGAQGRIHYNPPRYPQTPWHGRRIGAQGCK